MNGSTGHGRLEGKRHEGLRPQLSPSYHAMPSIAPQSLLIATSCRKLPYRLGIVLSESEIFVQLRDYTHIR